MRSRRWRLVFRHACSAGAEASRRYWQTPQRSVRRRAQTYVDFLSSFRAVYAAMHAASTIFQQRGGEMQSWPPDQAEANLKFASRQPFFFRKASSETTAAASPSLAFAGLSPPRFARGAFCPLRRP